MSQSRQLAAIMFADIAGYTALMENDEVLALKYRERMKQKLEAEVLLHNGKIIKWMGDGVLCSFISAIESVRASFALQTTMQQQPIVPVRIGIHQATLFLKNRMFMAMELTLLRGLNPWPFPGAFLFQPRFNGGILRTVNTAGR
jgi:adenylate cyclase